MKNEAVGVDDLMELLRSRVQERRIAGDYPDGLEDELDQHFRRIVFHRVKAEVANIDDAVAKLDASIDFQPRQVEVDSSFPGGEIFHRALDRALNRQRQALLEQMSEFAEGVRQAVHALADAVKDPHSHVHADLVSNVDSILERLDSYERKSATPRDAIAGD